MKRLLSLLVIMMFSCASYATGKNVDINWLKQNLNAKDTVIIDMADGLQYQRFHIPGAINLPYDALNTTRKTDRASISIGKNNVVKLLGQTGIARNTRVVIYDDMGGLNASRLYWELTRLQHPEFVMVDGGLVSWILAGNRVTNKPTSPTKTIYTVPKSVSSLDADDYTATVADIKNIKKSTQILDVRTTEEYQGNIKYPRSGHIPGAINWSWDNALDLEQGFRLKARDKLSNELKSQGIDKDKPTIVYCRSGHRASQTFYTLQSLGFKNVKLYDASMKGYAHDKSLPLTKGNQP